MVNSTTYTHLICRFRKLIALEGVIMKSMNASNKLYISIEDVSLNMENR